MSEISNLAYVEKGAKIGEGVVIEPFAVVKKNVILRDRVCIKSHAYVEGYTEIGEDSVVWPGASVGAKPQDLKFKGEKTYVKIGKNTEIREFVTVNSSCGEGTTVSIGDNTLIMAYCHVAHNCEIGSNVIIANNVQLAGHVTVDDYAIIGGMTPVHQFVRIGKHSMVGGMSRVSYDVPPFTLGSGVPYKIRGLNIIGLKRRAFSLERRVALTEAFKIVYRTEGSFADRIHGLSAIISPSEDVQHWIDFCKSSKRGLIDISPE
ncbi:acyl-[acyl-carrier-protein]--UDP-N-acetylglucosamine O-acyltransferase [Candidatus Aerophobetes bacterium]|uniref:Acyl-[acyl-carrier-protein]--UDP-N-acetylglucosamine O-acyltransferase n=1 Tax=Aerophobetes bacterium TaxID=2030807 RepID=A0A2A4X8C5_UNCAE|nr:MAG: acyl-[acyl-carrier-protein]--UDP-N-acetylglucosamine O-acyltransferase [Candidatus Aerophobetes bacterium]